MGSATALLRGVDLLRRRRLIDSPLRTALLPLGALEVLLGLAVLFFPTLLEIVIALGRHGFLVVEVNARGRDGGPSKLSATTPGTEASAAVIQLVRPHALQNTIAITAHKNWSVRLHPVASPVIVAHRHAPKTVAIRGRPKTHERRASARPHLPNTSYPVAAAHSAPSRTRGDLSDRVAPRMVRRYKSSPKELVKN